MLPQPSHFKDQAKHAKPFNGTTGALAQELAACRQLECGSASRHIENEPDGFVKNARPYPSLSARPVQSYTPCSDVYPRR